MPAPDYAVEIAQLEAQLATVEAQIQSGGTRGDHVVFATKSEILASLNYFRGRAAANANSKPATTIAAFDRD